MADISIRNPAVLAGLNQPERIEALSIVAAAARAVRSALQRAVAAMEPAQANNRCLARGFDR